MSDHNKASLFHRLRKGLEDSIAYSRGELSLRTTELPMPAPRTKPRQIVALRKKHRMSQAVFAATLNVSVKALQSWEQGIRRPSDAALRMLQVMDVEPGVVKAIFLAVPCENLASSAAKKSRNLASIGRRATKGKAIA